jgi:hypothetical protein
VDAGLKRGIKAWPGRRKTALVACGKEHRKESRRVRVDYQKKHRSLEIKMKQRELRGELSVRLWQR